MAKKAVRRKVSKIVTVTGRNIHKIDQMPKDTKFRAFKLSREDGRSWFNPERRPYLICRRGKILSVKHPDLDHFDPCGRGVNVATKTWCSDTRNPYYSAIIWEVSFTGKDIAAVPRCNNGYRHISWPGKFRLYRCKVVKKVRVFKGTL